MPPRLPEYGLMHVTRATVPQMVLDGAGSELRRHRVRIAGGQAPDGFRYTMYFVYA